MPRTVFLSGAVAIALVALGSLGCQPTPQPSATDMPAEATDEATDEIRDALAGLSPSDRESAERQRTCPVSGQLLGSMGEPIKLEVEGREVWICCAGCESALRDDPGQY